MERKNMNRLGKVLLPVAGVAAGLVLWMAPQVSGQQGGSGQPSTSKFEWPMYTADLKGSKYTPANQINTTNFNKLEVA
jgi:glucose dehydrogenase